MSDSFLSSEYLKFRACECGSIVRGNNFRNSVSREYLSLYPDCLSKVGR